MQNFSYIKIKMMDLDKKHYLGESSEDPTSDFMQQIDLGVRLN